VAPKERKPTQGAHLPLASARAHGSRDRGVECGAIRRRGAGAGAGDHEESEEGGVHRGDIGVGLLELVF
jgi:hypothetical protein